MIEYGPPGCSIFGGRPHADGLARLDPAGRAALEPLITTVPAWERPEPSAPLWIARLRDIAHWMPYPI